MGFSFGKTLDHAKRSRVSKKAGWARGSGISSLRARGDTFDSRCKRVKPRNIESLLDTSLNKNGTMPLVLLCNFFMFHVEQGEYMYPTIFVTKLRTNLIEYRNNVTLTYEQNKLLTETANNLGYMQAECELLTKNNKALKAKIYRLQKKIRDIENV